VRKLTFGTSLVPDSMAVVSLISVMSMITNPVMIARTILEGLYLEQAMRQQMITVFMITISNAVSCVIATYLVLWVCVKSEHHIRADCIHTQALLRSYSSTINSIIGVVGRIWLFVMSSIQRFLVVIFR